MRRASPLFGGVAVLARPVAFAGIRDVEGFCADAIIRTRLTLSRDEHDELLAEGLTILFELEAEWDGHGSFAAYSHGLLPLRITSAWHALHRGEHIEGKTVAGRKDWRYLPPVESWETVSSLPGFDETRVRGLTAFQRPVAA